MNPEAQTQTPAKDKKDIVISYKYYRSLIGIIGILLPFILLLGEVIALGQFQVRSSISNYYYSNMGDVFVGLLVVIAFFMVFYDYEPIDKGVTSFAGACAFCVAFFPHKHAAEYVQTVHFTSAILMLLAFAFISMFLFSRGRKHKWLHRVCGAVIVICIGVAAVYFQKEGEHTETAGETNMQVLYIAETVALLAFGTSWIVKAKILDQEEEGK